MTSEALPGADRKPVPTEGPLENSPGLVSVVIAAFNAESFIGETINSVLSQTYRPLEIIVVDDGSTDRTAEIVRKFEDRVQLLRLQASGGPSAPRNAGAALARGEFFSFFDADDVMYPGRVATQVRFLQRNPAAVAVAMDYRDFSGNADLPTSHFDTCVLVRKLMRESVPDDAVWSTETVRDTLLHENFGCTCAMMYRRGPFFAAGGFDQELYVGEDIELLYRVAAAGRVGVIDEVGFRRRLHASNVSNRTQYILREKIRSRQKMLQIEQSAARQRILRDLLAGYHLSLADSLARGAPGDAAGCLRRAYQYGEGITSAVSMKLLCKIALGAVGSLTRPAKNLRERTGVSR